MRSSCRLVAKRTMLGSLLPVSAAIGQSAYPSVPVPLDDSGEIALATSAAPREIAARVAVFTIGGGVPSRIHPGTNGFACMVSRDLHPGSSYPICFDAEGVRTRMQRELLQVQLRMQGLAEFAVATRVDAALRDGTLKMPQMMAVAYMMSPGQVIYSSPNPDADAEAGLRAFRETYEPFLCTLADYLVLPLPRWWAAGEELDNWQRSARGKAAKVLVEAVPAKAE